MTGMNPSTFTVTRLLGRRRRFVFALTMALTTCVAVDFSLAIAANRETSASAASTRMSPNSMEFVRTNCIDCHDGESVEGGFDANNLTAEMADVENVARWIHVYDRVEKGEMPPPEDVELDANERGTFLSATRATIQATEQSQRLREGRVRGRRLTNSQLQNTLNDLLCIDVPLASLMPPEQRSHGFVHLAESGAMIPPVTSASKLFAELFIDESRPERDKQAARVRQGRSIMDVVGDDAKSLQRTLGSGDRDRRSVG